MVEEKSLNQSGLSQQLAKGQANCVEENLTSSVAIGIDNHVPDAIGEEGREKDGVLSFSVVASAEQLVKTSRIDQQGADFTGAFHDLINAGVGGADRSSRSGNGECAGRQSNKYFLHVGQPFMVNRRQSVVTLKIFTV